MIAVLTWAEWLWAGVPMWFVGWYGRECLELWRQKRGER